MTNNPLWATQTTNTRTGADTWRCKECHGWDYAGNEGVYGDTSNSHYTNFPGILQVSGSSAINVFCAIHSGTNIDSRHNFSEELQPVDILHLTRFITETQSGTTPRGILDTSTHISSTGTIVGANHNNGDSLYNNSSIGCAASNCHGPNGDVQHEPLAELALDNPWETLHKIRFGHPGSAPEMPAFSDPSLPAASRLTLTQSKDVVAHAQTLSPSASTNCQADFAGLVGQIALADAAQGGQLYDKWWVAAGAQAPTADHPLWSTRSQPTINTRTGPDTWRCKECHGWDYAGVEGVYGNTTNSHYTGFPSLLSRTAGAQPIEVFCAIRSGEGINPAHNFTTVMSDTQILHLTKFITSTRTGTMPLGIISTTSLISSTGVPLGADSANGGNLYNGSLGCGSSNCHGPNGDLHEEPLGVLSVDNPWETLHKIRFGHPGSIPVMPSYSESITISESNDIVAFAQTLGAGSGGGGGGGTPPPASDASTIAMGGRLYDNWISETGSSVPPINNPVWALQNSNNRSGGDTWRCKECHGWDYKGVDGVYGDPDNSHYTGFGGILNTEKTEQEIVTYLTNGFFYAPTQEMMHVFGTLLTPEQITALAMFIKQGMVDSSPYFGMDTIINGSLANFENGEYLYSFRGFAAPTAGCELCHNADGLGEQGVNLGDIANTNPWEFLHKIRFGQPATAMPAMFDAEDANGFLLFDIQDAVDVIQYSQSLP
jgi:mono/diheme cytochrome c family protein